MSNTPWQKEEELAAILAGINGCVVAFSGGLDSTYLAAMAARNVSGTTICVTMQDQATPAEDMWHAMEAASRLGLEHIILRRTIPKEVRANGPDRCYICKRRLFTELETIRGERGLEAILDGENASDADDDRPGSRAAREAGVRSPLAEAGMTKPEIMELARAAGIAEWDRSASACLSTRVPTGTHIEDEVLTRVDSTEDFIRSKGIRMIRARAEGGRARLELGQDENTPENRRKLASLESEIKAFGWAAVEIDPAGYIPAGKRKRNG